MDSLTQLALGAAVSVAVMGRRTAVWKAALWGGVAATAWATVFAKGRDPDLNKLMGAQSSASRRDSYAPTSQPDP